MVRVVEKDKSDRTRKERNESKTRRGEKKTTEDIIMKRKGSLKERDEIAVEK